MPLIYEFELNAKERKRVQDIQADLFEKMLNGALHTDEGWNSHMTAYGNEMRDIYEKARERTLKYYSERPGNLYKALEAEIKNYVAIVCGIDESRVKVKSNPLDMDKWRKDFEDRIAPYMEILKGYDAEQCEKLSAFIQYAFEHREEFKEVPEKIKTHRAKELMLDRSKVNRAIRDEQEALYEENGLIVTTGHARKKPIYTPVLLDYLTEEIKKRGLTVEGVGHLDAFDAEILMHCESIYEAGNKKFTLNMLASQMAGGRKIEATPDFKKAVFKSLMRLRLTNITINAESEFDAGFNKEKIFSGVVLPNKYESGAIIFNGREVVDEFITVLDSSPLFKYADSKNQISRPPVNMLDVGMSLTRENVLLVHYLTRRIVDMQNSDERRGKYIIRYDSIFEYLKIEEASEKKSAAQMFMNKKAKIRKNVRAILNDWKQKGIIKDFEELDEDDKPPKSRAPIAKIKISMPKKYIEIESTEK